MIALVIATRNEHKVGEIQAILGNEFRCLALSEFGEAPETVEDAKTFAGNATKKATELARWLSLHPSEGLTSRTWKGLTAQERFVLADDSGLEVDALGGAPGVYSARFAALDTGQPGNSSAAENNAKLLHLLKDVPIEKRTARFRCVLALTPLLEPGQFNASPVCHADEFEMVTQLFEGACEGRIGFLPKGQGGFGYDPLFFPVGYEQTFGDLPGSIKNRLSHRGMALEQLKQRFRKGADGTAGRQ
jgi:XTP/dITP diphosphohydrolase